MAAWLSQYCLVGGASGGGDDLAVLDVRLELGLKATVAQDVLGGLRGCHDLGLARRERNGGLLDAAPVYGGLPHEDNPPGCGPTRLPTSVAHGDEVVALPLAVPARLVGAPPSLEAMCAS